MFPRSLSQHRSQQSSALVIVLAALVLVSGIIIVFFQQSTLNRQISYSSAGQYRADIMAHSALDTIASDLRNEIIAGSVSSSGSMNGVPVTANGVTVYFPSANSTVVPCLVSNQGFTNLVKQSASLAPFWSGTSYSGITSPIRSAASNNSATNSLNGRYIATNRWNKPGLLGDPGAGATPKNPPGTFNPPDWVLVTRQGPVTTATLSPFTPPVMATLSNKSATNQNYVVGRYAYTIYDEGGLLDVNVAGHPTSPSSPGYISSTDPFVTKRGLLPQVDLANLLSNPAINDSNPSTDADALVNWRNTATASTASLYTNYVFNATNGFVSVAGSGSQFIRTTDSTPFTIPSPGDQAFITRQDLIDFITGSGNGNNIPTSALQYLGTFTRAVNAPTYTPPSNRLTTLSGQGYRAIADPGNLDNQYNPSLVNTRVTTIPLSNSRYSDGKPFVMGEPLIKYRFPLSRLTWVGANGPNGFKPDGTSVSATDVMNAFGVAYSGGTLGTWTYNHGSINGRGNGQSILLLSDVASLGREPDFFELLQAGILVGSLGKSSGNTFAIVTAIDSNNSYQVIQIGANLIDQCDTDSFPTRILFGTTSSTYDGEIDGIENLPYLACVYETAYRIHLNSNQVGIWYQPMIWNPHAQANIPPTSPSQFRFLSTTGSGQVYINYHGDGDPPSPVNSPLKTLPDPASTGLQFSTSSSQTFTEPQMLTPSNASAAPVDTVSESGVSIFGQPGANFIGIFAGSATIPPNTGYDWAQATPDPFITHKLQYKNGSSWITYSEMRNIQGVLGTQNGDNFIAYYIPCYAERSDPRTDRFGAFGTDDGPITTTIRPSTSTGHYAQVGAAGMGWTFPGGGIAYMGYLSQNLQSLTTRYADPDSVQRRGDGAYTVKTTPTTVDGLPLATGNLTSRPVILNRPFRSVAEMGYASRGMPWKHLDFFTVQSPDAALLDLFCLNDESPSPAPAEAGQIDLNTKQSVVLQTILQGSIKAEDTAAMDGYASQGLSSTEASSLASILTTMTGTSPLLNRSELVTRWISSDTWNTPASPAPNVTTVLSSSDEIIKRRREAAVRALADVGNTRTWNLLVDVIAQSGQYIPTSTNLNQFLVAGEKRYWLHIAIDRYTGKIIAQSLEPVYE